MVVGLVPIYALGLGWLALFVPADQVFAAGFIPFILVDLVKVGVVAVAAGLISNPMVRLRGAC